MTRRAVIADDPRRAEPAHAERCWHRSFSGDSDAVSGARRFVIEVVVDHHLAPRESELADDLVLLASELAANAVLHAGGGFDVTVAVHEAVVRLEVADRSDALPRPRAPSPDQPGGRGYQIVGALAERWGFTKLPVGKSVWAEVRLGPGAS
ncbi:MAG: ATP-binding protein [Acidimicrobiales bacterium]